MSQLSKEANCTEPPLQLVFSGELESCVYTSEKIVDIAVIVCGGDLKRWEIFYWNHVAKRFDPCV